MDLTYFILWLVFASIGLLIFPIDRWMEKRDDNNRLKKWWKKHITDWDSSKDKSI